MEFDFITSKRNFYINIVLEIISEGVLNVKNKFNVKQNENYKNQKLAEEFNILGTSNEKVWIGSSTEHIKKNKNTKEDIYFYLNDENNTRVFFVEGKRLPKYGKKDEEEYVCGLSTTGKESGGIQRFKIGNHGEPYPNAQYGIIGYIESQSINFWHNKICVRIKEKWVNDSPLSLKTNCSNSFVSEHNFECGINGFFTMHHFWIDLSSNK
jgi:hypothetical protein